MALLRIRPNYGYGWAEDNTSMDTPPPFLLETEDLFPQQTGIIFGKIRDENHPLSGMFVVLALRTVGGMTYNLYADFYFPPDIGTLLKKNVRLPARITGFASIENNDRGSGMEYA